MTHLRAALSFLGLLFLIGCQTGPTAADVAADRDRWHAVFQTAADRVVDDQEAPLLDQLLVEWDQKLRVDEQRVAGAQSRWEDLARVYGAAVVQVVLAREIAAAAPELFRFIDRNSDDVLAADELAAIDPLNPVFAAAVVSTAVRLAAGKDR